MVEVLGRFDLGGVFGGDLERCGVFVFRIRGWRRGRSRFLVGEWIFDFGIEYG